MPRPSAHREALLELSSAQHGLATASQLAAIGVARSTVARRTRAGGMWTRVLPGVHLLNGGSPDGFQREFAALLFAGEGSVLTGLTALGHYGLVPPDIQPVPPQPRTVELVHVLVPHVRRKSSTAFVQIERTTRIPPLRDIVFLDDLPLAPITRAIADAGRRMRSSHSVTSLVLHSVRSGLASADDLMREAAAGQRRGSAHLREAIDHAAAGTWSVPESRLRDLFDGADLPRPVWNRPIATASGRIIGIPDAWFDAVALAVEVDSRQFHSTGPDWERTLRRQRRYASLGIACLPVTPAQIRDDPTGLLIEVENAYRMAAARPRPPVRLMPPLSLDERRAFTVRWAG